MNIFHRRGAQSAQGGSDLTVLGKIWSQILPELLRTRISWLFVLAIAMLSLISLAAVKVCGPQLFIRQQIHLAIGVAILLLALIPGYRKIGALSYFLYGISCLLLLAVLFSPAVKGSHRWFILPGGMNFQPSELAKITFVLTVAWSLRMHRECREFRKLLFPFALMIPPMCLILVESDLGTALLFPPVLYAMLIAAGARFRHLIAIALIVLAAAPWTYTFLKPYQKQRIVALFTHGKPTKAQLHGNLYQKQQSEIAEGSGALTGRGLRGADEIRHGLLPEAANDFIFAVVGSQWGFVGAVTILVLYLLFFGGCLEIAGNSADPFGRLLVIGLSSMIILQAIINIAMTTGLIPVVGITLPFMSYGGSAVAADMLATSLILNVAMRERFHRSALGLPPP